MRVVQEKNLLLGTDVSTTKVVVIFRVKLRVSCQMTPVFMPLVVVFIGQFCRDVISRQNLK